MTAIVRLALALSLGALLCFSASASPKAGGGSVRLAGVRQTDPFYPGATFPKLTTPQWVGESNVEAVVILAIDDMSQPERWEKFLRPILQRLNRIDGRSPVSIMSVSPDPQHPQLGSWLKEGLSLEVHTLTHPCPCLAQGNFPAAVQTYQKCVELMNRIVGNRPVAFRMPCCDSMNSPSPRFYSEIFSQPNAAGQFLTIDSSVMNIMTTNDSSLSPELMLETDGRDKFRKYVPFPSFTTTIENYPYPYVIGNLCWEFPGAVPSDWEAQHHHGTNHPATVKDWKVLLDITVMKQGVMNLIFHPHGWIASEQIVELIDYAHQRHGGKVKFLTFREAQDRLDTHLLAGHPLRTAQGSDNGVRLLDVDGDGHLDVITANERVAQTRTWNSSVKTWKSCGFPVPLVGTDPKGYRFDSGVRFGFIRPNGRLSVLVRNDTVAGAWTFDGSAWIADASLLWGLELEGRPLYTAHAHSGQGMVDRGVRLRDLDGDGQEELLISNEAQQAAFGWSEQERCWKRLPYALPASTSIVDAQGRDNGLRFVDVNQDGFDDVLFSNEKQFSLHLFVEATYLGFQTGWSREVCSGQRGEPGQIPMITRSGSNNGAWFHGRNLYVQNEDTAAMPDKVERRSFDTLLSGLLPPSLSPAESLKAIHVRPGFKVDLVAQEPLVQDPIAFDWGADGKLWVVEMGDYPLAIEGHSERGGRVRFLQDTNSDGIYDQSTVFLHDLNFPTGVIPWGKGIVVSAAPDILYAEDTDGDGVADVRQVLFSGFGEGNQQHRVNGFDYGLDGWLYGANGDSGGVITKGVSLGKPRRHKGKFDVPSGAVDISRRDFRFNPSDGRFEAQPGQTQFGRHRDDWGNWFGNNNNTWLWHYFLPEHYLARNPHLAVPANKQMLANYQESTRVFPISRPQQRLNDVGTAGHTTAANSATPYRDELFGPDFSSSVFISDAVYNLVHREILETDGVTFTSRRATDEQQSEFLASTDPWFRPTMIKTGPNGALYIADMYRLVIEHPEWIPDDLKHKLDLRAGYDKGRIYRVSPRGAELRPVPKLDQLDISGLVSALDSPNGWQRDTAQRLLIERGDRRAIPALSRLVQENPRAKTRLQSLAAINCFGACTPELLLTALQDSHAAVREQAVQFSEQFFELAAPSALRRGTQWKQLGETLLAMVNDESLRVRYQLAFSFGAWGDRRAAAALVSLALHDLDHPPLQLAVMSSAPPHLRHMLPQVLAACHTQPEASKLLDQLFALAAAVNDKPTLTAGLSGLVQANHSAFAPWQFAAIGGLLDSLEQRGKSWRQLQAESSTELAVAMQALDSMFAQARQWAEAESVPLNTERVLAAIRLLGRGGSEQEPDLIRLASLLSPQQPIAIQQAALAALKRADGKTVPKLLLERWQSSSPASRLRIADALLSRTDGADQLLFWLERSRISLAQITIADQQKLLNHRDQPIAERAAKLFATASQRQEVVQKYRQIETLAGDQVRGEKLFAQNCASCHRPQGRPPAGPDLSDARAKSVASLLESILDPNRAVEARFVNYSAVSQSDREIGGVLIAETATSITLRSPAGEETILRTDLWQLNSSGLSPMPEGFEKVLSPAEMADLLAYLRR